MIIDWHSHWIPKPLAERVARHRPLPPAPEFFDVDMRLRHMDASGISRQVVSWPVAFGFDALLPLSEVAALYREYNDSLAGMVAAHPDRFCGLAAVPTADPQRAADELARARSELGLIGAVIPADAFLTPLSAHAYSALLGEADRHRSHLYVHPGPTGFPVAGNGPIAFLRVDSASPRWLLEAGTRLSASALTLETSGVLDAYPEISVHVAMMGGHLGWIAETLEERASKSGEHQARVVPLRRIYVDTGILKPGGRALDAAVNLLGADRILFGSDYPQFATSDPAFALRQSGLSEQNLRLVMHANADLLLGRFGVSTPVENKTGTVQ